MIKGTELVEEGLDSHRLVAQVLHVNLALHLVNQVHSRCQHAHSADPVYALGLLENPLLGQLLIKGWHAVLL